MTSEAILQKSDVAGFVDAGVFFIDTLRDLASKLDTPQPVKADWNVIQRWLGNDSEGLTIEDKKRIRDGWKAYIAIGLAPNDKLQNTFDLLSATLLATEPTCKSQKPPTTVMDVFDRLLASDTEIAHKRAKDIAAEKERLRPVIARLSDVASNRKALSSTVWRDRPSEFRKWAFFSTVWFSAVVFYAVLFDPFDHGAWRYWSEADVFKITIVSLIPAIAWRLKVFYDRYVK